LGYSMRKGRDIGIQYRIKIQYSRPDPYPLQYSRPDAYPHDPYPLV